MSRRILIAAALIGLGFWFGSADARAEEGDPVLDAAEAYIAFRIDAAALGGARIETLADLDSALDIAARHNSDALSRGWIAYGALSAARSPAFAAGVASVTRRYGRTAVLRALARDPSYPGRRRGYGEAVSLILAAADEVGRATRADADRFEAAATQPHLWSDSGVPDERALRLRRLGAAGFVSRAETREGLAALTFAAPQGSMRLAPGHAATARRMASLAAMRILNARGDWIAHMRRMLGDEPTQGCIALEQLQFYQCVAVTHVAEEAASCLSRHALTGVSDCMSALVAD